MDALLVDESEVRVIHDGDDLLALRGRSLDRRDDLLGVVESCRVAGGVVREVENEKLLVARLEKRLFHGRHVEAPLLEGVERLDLGAAGIFENKLVVIPEKIRHDNLVGLVGKELGAYAQAVSEGIRDDRVGERLAFERGILAHHEIAPGVAQSGCRWQH